MFDMLTYLIEPLLTINLSQTDTVTWNKPAFIVGLSVSTHQTWLDDLDPDEGWMGLDDEPSAEYY